MVFLITNKKSVFFIIAFFSSLMLLLVFQNCSKTNFTQSQAPQYSKVLAADGVDIEVALCKKIITNQKLKDCSQPVILENGKSIKRSDWEREQALLDAEKDPSLVPVEFAYSFGTKDDELSQVAHQRAILTEERGLFTDSKGFSFTPVFVADRSGVTETMRYKADHSLAKEQYLKGERCFYSTIKIDKSQVMESTLVSKLSQSAKYMISGYCESNCADSKSRYGSGTYGKSYYPNRLFSQVPSKQYIFEEGKQTQKKESQFIKLYVADIRDSQIGLSTKQSKMIKISEKGTLGQEVVKGVDEFMDVDTLLVNFDTVVKRLSNPAAIEKSSASDKNGSNPRNLAADSSSPQTLEYSGVDGAAQVLANLCSTQINITALAENYAYTPPPPPPTNYDPIVVDLGRPLIKTTGVRHGVMFNMSGVANQKIKTAWIGGYFKKEQQVSEAGVSFEKVVAVDAEDGFLVLPNSDGSVIDAKNLFSNVTKINGKTYSNGFEALIALTNKNCRSSNIKDQYFGPWDGELYNSTVKVWIDRNINGLADVGEIVTLKEAGVAAVNTCYSNKYGSKDTYGNKTEVQSLMIYQQPLVASEIDITNTIKGMRVNNPSASGIERRLSVDVYFLAEEKE